MVLCLTQFFQSRILCILRLINKLHLDLPNKENKRKLFHLTKKMINYALNTEIRINNNKLQVKIKLSSGRSNCKFIVLVEYQFILFDN